MVKFQTAGNLDVIRAEGSDASLVCPGPGTTFSTTVDIISWSCFTCRMDKDGSLEISFNEWRDFLLYAPSTDIHELILYWRHSTVSTIPLFCLNLLFIVVGVVSLCILLVVVSIQECSDYANTYCTL